MIQLLISFVSCTLWLLVLAALGLEPNATTLFGFGCIVFINGVHYIVVEIRKLKS